MNKIELVAAIAEGAEITKVAATSIVDAFISSIKKELGKGESVELSGFGSWKVIKKSAKTGRNPQTGKAIKIPAHKVVKFKVGKLLKDFIN